MGLLNKLFGWEDELKTTPEPQASSTTHCMSQRELEARTAVGTEYQPEKRLMEVINAMLVDWFTSSTPQTISFMTPYGNGLINFDKDTATIKSLNSGYEYNLTVPLRKKDPNGQYFDPVFWVRTDNYDTPQVNFVPLYNDYKMICDIVNTRRGKEYVKPL